MISSPLLEFCVPTCFVGFMSKDMYSDSEEISGSSFGVTSDSFCSDSTGEYYGDNENDDMSNLML